MGGTGNFFAENDIGIKSERIYAVTPGFRVFADDAPATTKVQRGLRRSRASY